MRQKRITRHVHIGGTGTFFKISALLLYTRHLLRVLLTRYTLNEYKQPGIAAFLKHVHKCLLTSISLTCIRGSHEWDSKRNQEGSAVL